MLLKKSLKNMNIHLKGIFIMTIEELTLILYALKASFSAEFANNLFKTLLKNTTIIL